MTRPKKRQPKRLRLVPSPNQIARVAAALAWIALGDVEGQGRDAFQRRAERLINHLALVVVSS